MTLPQSDRALREATRFVAYRESMPAVLRPQPLAYDLLITTDQGDQRQTVSDLPGASMRQQRAARFRFLEAVRAGKLTQPTPS
jgi:hypothetical protein